MKSLFSRRWCWLLAFASMLLATSQQQADASIIRVTSERQDCADGRYCRRVRDCGSGVVIATQADRTYALTAAHVVSRSGGTLRVQETASAKVIARDDQADVALIEIAGRYEGAVSQLGDATEGSAVHLCGYGPGRLERFDGILSSPEWITATARDGDSGGPVFDSQSRVVGIATAVDQQGRTLIVPSATLKSFVARHCPHCVTASQKSPAPIVTVDIPDREKTARIALLESRLATAEATLKALQSRPSPQSVVGPQGLPGIPGRDGRPGKDAVTLPLTVTLNTLDDSGSIVGSVTKTYQPGEPVILNFRPIQSAK